MKVKTKGMWIIVGVVVTLGLLLGSFGCEGAPPATTTATTATTTAPKPITLVVSDGHPIHIPCATVIQDTFIPEATRLAKEAGYDLNFTENYGGSLTKCLETLEGTESGLCDIGFSHYFFEPAKMPLHNISYYTPFDCTDPRIIARAVQNMCEEFPWIEEYPEENYNQKVLAQGFLSNYGMYTNFPVKTPEDLKGHKIAGAGPNLEWLEALGSTPVQITIMEAYTDLQTGVYDGLLLLADMGVSFKLYEVAPYWTSCDLGAQWGGMLSINLDTWNDLPKEVQDALVKAGELYNVEQPKRCYELGLEALDLLQEEANVYELTATDKARWANSLDEIPNRHAEEANALGMPGTELYQAYYENIENEGFSFLRQWEID